MEKTPEDNLSLEQLKALGIDITKLSQKDLDSLMSYKRSGLMPFIADDTKENREFFRKENIEYKAEAGKLHYEAKLRTQKVITVDNTPENVLNLKGKKIDYGEYDNKLKLNGNITLGDIAKVGLLITNPVIGVALIVIPKRNKIKNDRSLSWNEKRKLKNGDVVARTENRLGRKEKMLLQVDKDTLEVIAIKARDLKIPNEINGVTLTPIQKEQFSNGREIKLNHLEGDLTAKIDLNSPSGIRVKHLEQNKKEETKESTEKTMSEDLNKTDQYNAQERKTNPINLNDLEKLFMISRGEKVDQVLKDISEDEKFRFLEKYKLERDYNTAQGYKQSLPDHTIEDSLLTMDAKGHIEQAEMLIQYRAHNEIAKMGLVDPIEKTFNSLFYTNEQGRNLEKEINTALKSGYSLSLSDNERLTLISVGENINNVFKGESEAIKEAFLQKYDLKDHYDKLTEANIQLHWCDTAEGRQSERDTIDYYTDKIKEVALEKLDTGPELNKTTTEEKISYVDESPFPNNVDDIIAERIERENDRDTLKLIADGLDIDKINFIPESLKEEFLEKYNLKEQYTITKENDLEYLFADSWEQCEQIRESGEKEKEKLQNIAHTEFNKVDQLIKTDALTPTQLKNLDIERLGKIADGEKVDQVFKNVPESEKTEFLNKYNLKYHYDSEKNFSSSVSDIPHENKLSKEMGDLSNTIIKQKANNELAKLDLRESVSESHLYSGYRSEKADKNKDKTNTESFKQEQGEKSKGKGEDLGSLFSPKMEQENKYQFKR